MQYPVIFLKIDLRILITSKFRRLFFYSGKQDATRGPSSDRRDA